MTIFAVAGHVDHGKSTLLHNLTGMAPSRLKEERARGMTIELGYVWIVGDDGAPIPIIDVPGHSDFRKTMIKGLTEAQAFILVIAADDGWMPQTWEHAWLLRSLGIMHGICLLTKTDTVTADDLEKTVQETRKHLAQLHFSDTKIFMVSNKKMETVAPVAEAIKGIAKDATLTAEGSGINFTYDRRFVRKGVGVVVTGSLLGGQLRVGKKLNLLPQGTTVTIKGMQGYERDIDATSAGNRVALQLGGISYEDVASNGQLVDAEDRFSIDAFDATFLPFSPERRPRESRRFGIHVVHNGSILAAQAQVSGDFVRVHLASPRSLKFGDMFVILASGDDFIWGVGRVLDGAPEKTLRKAVAWLSSVTTFSIDDYLEMQFTKKKTFERGDVRATTRFRDATLTSYLEKNTRWTSFGSYITKVAHLEEVATHILETLTVYHKKNPESLGLSVAGIRQNLNNVNTHLLDQALRCIIDKRELTFAQGIYCLATFSPRLSTEQHRFLELLKRISQDTLPNLVSLKAFPISKPDYRPMLKSFLDARAIARMSEEHVMGRAAFDACAQTVVEKIRHDGPQNIAALRDALGLSRRVTLSILEVMDREKITFFRDDLRYLTDT